MADCTLMALLHSTGQAAGLAEDALASLGHVPLFQHFANILMKEDHFVSPEDAELAEAQANYESNPDLADQEAQQLLELRLSNPELVASELADDPEIREVIEQILKHDELIKQADGRLARSRSHLATLHENSQAVRLQQQQAEQGLARQARAVEHRVAAAASRNAADNRTVQAMQECARVMQDLLHKSSDKWLLLALSLDELRDIEKSITAEISKAKEQLCPRELARRLADQQAAQGALPDTPFAPSGTRMLTGLEPEQYATVLAEAGRIGTSGRMMRDRAERLQAELAGLQRQVELLQQLADDAADGGLGSSPCEWQARNDPEAHARLYTEAEALRQQLHSLHDGEQRQALLDQLSAVFTAQVKRALWLLRHQQLGYMTQLQRQLLEVLLQQWSRTELIQMCRAEERQSLHSLFISLRTVCEDLEEAARMVNADTEEFRAVVSAAEAQAILATDRGPQALLGVDASLCAAFSLLDCQRQRLQLLQQQQETGLPAQTASDAGAGGLAQQGASAPASLQSPRAAGPGVSMGGSGSFGSVGGGAAGGNAFLDSVLADPAHRSVAQLAAGVDAVLSLISRLEQQLQHRVCGQLGRLVAEGHSRVEEMRQMLAGPDTHMQQLLQQQQQQQQQQQGDVARPQSGQQMQQQQQQQQQQSMVGAGGAAQASNSSTRALSTVLSRLEGPGAQKPAWPVMRDPAFEAELAATKADVEHVLADIQGFVSRQNMLLDGQRRQSEQSRLERGVLAAFWNAPEQLLCDVQALRDRLAALLSSQ